MAVEKKLPKLFLHCPDSYPPSVVRLREIHESINSKEPLPAPKTIKVVELIHGVGPAAHSHYYLAGQKHDEDHHDEDHPEEEKLHDVVVDVFTELRDIAFVLPNVAAASDMGKEDWLAVRKASQRMVDVVDEVMSDAETADQRRAALVGKSKELGELIGQLEAANSSPEETDKETE